MQASTNVHDLVLDLLIKAAESNNTMDAESFLFEEVEIRKSTMIMKLTLRG